jgi:hypothetical protein
MSIPRLSKSYSLKGSDFSLIFPNQRFWEYREALLEKASGAV